MRIVRYYPRALVGDGGMTGAVKNWSQALVAAGAQVVIAYERGMDPPSSNGVEWAEVPHVFRKGFKVPVGIEDILRGADLLVLHSGWVVHGIRSAGVARKLGVPYLLEPRGAYDPHILGRKRLLKRGWWTAFERNLVMQSRAVHVFFAKEREHLGRLGYEGDFVVAPNGVLDAEASWDGGSGGYLLWLGRFDPEHKGLDLLIDAVNSMSVAERPTLRLHGPDWRQRKSKVVALIKNAGLEKWVSVNDAVYGTEKIELLSRASGFVYPSRWDACPNSVLQSVSMGLPTLVTTYPLGEMLASKSAAVLANPDPMSLAEGLRFLSSDAAAAIGANGASVANEHFQWNHVARIWLAQVEDLL